MPKQDMEEKGSQKLALNRKVEPLRTDIENINEAKMKSIFRHSFPKLKIENGQCALYFGAKAVSNLSHITQLVDAELYILFDPAYSGEKTYNLGNKTVITTNRDVSELQKDNDIGFVLMSPSTTFKKEDYNSFDNKTYIARGTKSSPGHIFEKKIGLNYIGDERNDEGPAEIFQKEKNVTEKEFKKAEDLNRIASEIIQSKKYLRAGCVVNETLFENINKTIESHLKGMDNYERGIIATELGKVAHLFEGSLKKEAYAAQYSKEEPKKISDKIKEGLEALTV